MGCTANIERSDAQIEEMHLKKVERIRCQLEDDTYQADLYLEYVLDKLLEDLHV